jgi:hypothetical protein
LIGGLGNQMFQYATGRRLADHLQTDLLLDISGYANRREGDPPRQYDLGCFPVRAELHGVSPSPGASGGRPAPIQLRRVLAKVGFGGRNIIKEKGIAFDQRVLTAPDGTYLSGYWQNERYFLGIRSRLLEDFSLTARLDPTNQAMGELIHKVTSVSLHVRRGDYVTNSATNKFHGTMSLAYYARAVEIVASMVERPHFFVFSDDPVWCQENLRLDHPTSYVTQNTSEFAYMDMWLMAQCQHHIVANSSFSWWGAWLNPSKEKIVVAPKQWFSKPSTGTPEITPAEWLTI